jgi:hypothetical protein
MPLTIELAAFTVREGAEPPAPRRASRDAWSRGGGGPNPPGSQAERWFRHIVEARGVRHVEIASNFDTSAIGLSGVSAPAEYWTAYAG